MNIVVQKSTLFVWSAITNVVEIEFEYLKPLLRLTLDVLIIDSRLIYYVYTLVNIL